MAKRIAIAAAALLAVTFMGQPAAEARIGAAPMGGIETSAVDLVHGRRHHRGDREWRPRPPRRHAWQPQKHRFRYHHRLTRYGFSRFGQFRWDHGAFVVRAWHPRYGWCWVRVSAHNGRPLAYWY